MLMPGPKPGSQNFQMAFNSTKTKPEEGFALSKQVFLFSNNKSLAAGILPEASITCSKINTAAKAADIDGLLRLIRFHVHHRPPCNIKYPDICTGIPAILLHVEYNV